MDFHRLGPVKTGFLGLNLLCVGAGLALLCITGPTLPLVLLLIGAVGMALGKLSTLFGWDDAQKATPEESHRPGP